MKVQKLNEDINLKNYSSSEDFINSIKDIRDEDELKQTYRELLTKCFGGNGGRSVDRVLSFGINFINRWIKAMKWEELTDPSNEFVIIMKDANSFGTDTPKFLENKENFTKLYNAYSNNYFSKSYYEEPVFKAIVNSDRLYGLSDREVRNVFRIYDELASKNTSSEELRNVFFDEDEKLNSLDTIKIKVGEESQGKKDNKYSEFNANLNRMSNDDLNDFAKVLKNNNRFVQAFSQ